MGLIAALHAFIQWNWAVAGVVIALGLVAFVVLPLSWWLAEREARRHPLRLPTINPPPDLPPEWR